MQRQRQPLVVTVAPPVSSWQNFLRGTAAWDERRLAAIARLVGTPDGEALLVALQDWHEWLAQQLENEPAETVPQLQGAAKFVRALKVVLTHNPAAATESALAGTENALHQLPSDGSAT